MDTTFWWANFEKRGSLENQGICKKIILTIKEISLPLRY
jgi:hypothetical protein